MYSIRLSADSTCDLSPEQIKKYDIGIMPLYVSLGEEALRDDGIEVTAQMIFDYVAKTGELPKTSAPSVSDYLEFFRSRQTDPDQQLIHFTISADFSSAFQNASLAAQELKNVTVIDSRNLSTGHGHTVIEAAVLREKGATVEEIAEYEEYIIPKIRASFIIDRLDYLHKGGRCSGVAALGANLLRLKPCIEVVDGKMKVGRKYRGTFEKVLLQYTEDKLKGTSVKKDLIFITHTGASKEAVEGVRRKISEVSSFDEIVETRAGSTITSHCGQNTLGILFIEK